MAGLFLWDKKFLAVISRPKTQCQAMKKFQPISRSLSQTMLNESVLPTANFFATKFCFQLCSSLVLLFRKTRTFSNINVLNSRAETLFATKDFDSRAHI